MEDRWKKGSSLGQPAFFSGPGVCRLALPLTAFCTFSPSQHLHGALEPSRKDDLRWLSNCSSMGHRRHPSSAATSDSDPSSVSPCRQSSLWTNCCEKWTQPKTESCGSESTKQATFAQWTWRSRSDCLVLGVLLRRGAGGPMEKGLDMPYYLLTYPLRRRRKRASDSRRRAQPGTPHYSQVIMEDPQPCIHLED